MNPPSFSNNLINLIINFGAYIMPAISGKFEENLL